MEKLKYIIIATLLVLSIVFFQNWQTQKKENALQKENASQLRKADSLRFTTQILTPEEIQEYLDFQNKELKKYLEDNEIKTNRIETIVSQKIIYRDSIVKEYLTLDKKLNFIDSTKCLIIKGVASFKNDTLSVKIQNREFKNKSDAVAYWQRRQWNFLGFKTRFLGKKEFTAIQFDECGQSQILKIEKKK